MTSASHPGSTTHAEKTLDVNVRLRLSADFNLDAAFAVPAGITVLFGPSGAGKSTLLDCMAGLRQPGSGRIALGGRILFDSSSGANVPIRHRRIGYVLQSLGLFPHMSVQQNVEYGLNGLGPDQRRQRAAAILETFGLDGLAGQSPARLSGGERQRVALARVLVTEPEALLLDEPLAALDARTKSRIITDLRAWNDARRIPVVYVTHSRDEVFALGERVVAIHAGRLLAQGTPQELLNAPRHELLAQLAGFENIVLTEITARDPASGTMTCQICATAVSLEVPLGPEAAGDSVRIGIRAGDILLATRKPEGISARNLLRGRLLRLERRDATVIAEVDCGFPFQVHLTPGAQQSLQLSVEGEVWLVIKTYSCHPLRPE